MVYNGPFSHKRIDFYYADDIALLSRTANHRQQKAHLLTENAKKTGLQINQKKTTVMCMNLGEHPQIKIDGEEFEVVTDFAYLGTNISVQNSIYKYISPESTNHGITTVDYVPYENVMYIA